MSGAFGQQHGSQTAYPQATVYQAGPWRGTRDNVDPTSAESNAPENPGYGVPARGGLARQIRNMVPEDAEIGGGLVCRPGFARAAASGQLGTSGHRRTQGFHEFVKLDGTIYRLVVCSGTVYTYDWGTALFTSHALGGSLVLDPDAPDIFVVTFADRAIFSDGIHAPISWDGTTFAALTNCPVLRGKPWVYYAQLFGLKAAEQDTMVWSAVNDPTTGYEAGGFNNAWTLGQTDQHPLRAGIGFNDGMVICRGRSTTAITGAVSAEFASTGTREGVSETVGTETPGAIVVVNRTIYLLDADRRPQKLTLDAGYQDRPPLWADCRETVRSIPATPGLHAIGVYEPLQNVVLLGVPGVSATEPNFFLVIDGSSGAFIGIWTGFTATAIGLWTDTNGKPRLLHGELDGIPYVHGLPHAAPYDDGLDAGTQSVDHYLETAPLGYDSKVEKDFSRVDLSIRALTALSGSISVRLATSETVWAPQLLSSNGGLALWDASTWDASTWSTESSEQHADCGVLARGRWARVIVEHNALGEAFGLMRVDLEAHLLGPDPRAP